MEGTGAFVIGMVIGALVMGALVGLIPLILGLKKNKKGLAWGGFAACIVGSFILGIWLSIPLCILFVILILVLKDKTPQVDQQFDPQVNQQFGQPMNQQFDPQGNQQFDSQGNQQFGQPMNQQFDQQVNQQSDSENN